MVVIVVVVVVAVAVAVALDNQAITAGLVSRQALRNKKPRRHGDDEIKDTSMKKEKP